VASKTLPRPDTRSCRQAGGVCPGKQLLKVSRVLVAGEPVPLTLLPCSKCFPKHPLTLMGMSDSHSSSNIHSDTSSRLMKGRVQVLVVRCECQ